MAHNRQRSRIEEHDPVHFFGDVGRSIGPELHIVDSVGGDDRGAKFALGRWSYNSVNLYLRAYGTFRRVTRTRKKFNAPVNPKKYPPPVVAISLNVPLCMAGLPEIVTSYQSPM